MTVTAPGSLIGLYTLTNVSSESQILEGRAIPVSASTTVDYIGASTALAIAQGLVTITPALTRTTPATSPLTIGSGVSPVGTGYLYYTGYGLADFNFATLATEVITLGNTLAGLQAWRNEVGANISLSR